MTNKEWFERLLRVESSDATWRSEDFPIVVECAKDSMIWDVEGNPYIDMIAGFGALPLGHNNDAIQNIIKDNSNKLVHGLGDVYASRFKIEFIEKILSFLPSYLNRAVLAVTGSQAVELAMKTAILATGGSGFICFKDAYHGLDLGCLAITANPYFQNSFKPWLNANNVQALPFQCDPQNIRKAIQKFREQGIKPAGIVVEPIQGRGGFKAASIAWLQSLKDICKEEDCLLIFDEVFTGFGRSGRVTFADEVECDLVCFGKAIGGGMPISICVGNKKHMDAWPINGGEAIHTGTFFGHPLSCRVGIETLEQIKNLDLVNRSQEIGSSFLAELKKSLGVYSCIQDIRGKGLMIAIEFKKAEHSISAMLELRSQGVFLIPCGIRGECVSLTPALNISESLLDEVHNRLVEVIARLEKQQ